jgi:hypothetical protein
MEDIFKKYKKFQFSKNSAIICASLFFALGINLGLNWELSQHMKASVLGTQTEIRTQADVYIQAKDNKIIIKNWSNFWNFKKMNFSLLYNSESINILNSLKTIDNYSIIEIIRDNWIINVQIIWDASQDIIRGTTLAEIDFEKIDTSESNVSVLNVHFEDDNNNIMYLTSSSTEI